MSMPVRIALGPPASSSERPCLRRFIAAHPKGLSVRKIRDGVAIRATRVDDLVDELEREGTITVAKQEGRGGGKVYRIAAEERK